MKKIVVIVIVLISNLSTSQTINIKNLNGTRIDGAYYKDIDFELNQFEGTYQYLANNGDDNLTIVFKKIEDYYNGKFYQDLLVGEVKLRKDGTDYYDNLHKINIPYDNPFKHDINGNTLMVNQMPPSCDDCVPNQYRARISFFGHDDNCGGYIILQKFTENNQQKIKASFFFNCSYEPHNLEPILTGGDYILTRIN
jgi:hypothetical protein